MWASIEAAQKAGIGTHTAIRIDNLRFDEGTDESSRVDLMVDGLSTAGLVAQKSDTSVGLTPDQGSRQADPLRSDCDRDHDGQRPTPAARYSGREA